MNGLTIPSRQRNLASHQYGVTATRRVAKKQHRCQWGDCRMIQIGDVYVESKTFPGHDSGYADAAGHPVRMAFCARCALRFGYDLWDIPFDQLCRDGLL
jgi:hypothetical protein